MGCGTGFFALPAAEIVGDRGVVYAVDEVQEILRVLEQKISEQRIQNIRIVKSNLMTSPIPSLSVDFGLMACIFHDLPRRTVGV